MKLVLRWIIGVPMFIIGVAGMYTAIPLGLLALIMGLGVKFHAWLTNEQDTTEWEFVFAGIILPYYECKKFIYGSNNKSKS